MTTHKILPAKETGENSFRPANAPAALTGADDLEGQLDRILARVPPIITLPKPKQKCPFTGLSRSCFLTLIAPCDRNEHRPPVRAIYRRSHKHAVRGKWMVPSECVFRYLLSLEAGSVETYSKLAAERKQGKA